MIPEKCLKVILPLVVILITNINARISLQQYLHTRQLHPHSIRNGILHVISMCLKAYKTSGRAPDILRAELELQNIAGA